MNKLKQTWIYKLILHCIGEITEKPLGTFAASTSFFFFFSLIPSLILVSTILPLTPLSVEDLLFVADNLVPDISAPVIESIITKIYSFSSGKLTISLLVTLWTAGLAVCELIRAVNLAYDYKEERNYIKLRIYASIYTVLLMALMLVSLLFFVIWKNILLSLYTAIPGADFALSPVKEFFYLFMTFISLFVIFLLLYSKMAAKATPIWRHVPGAIVASIFWVIFTMVFSWIIRIFNLFSGLGSLAALVVTLIWIYCCMYAIIIGATINTFCLKIRYKKEGV